MAKRVDIFTGHGPVSIFIVLLKGGAVLFGIYLLVQAFSRGETGQVLWGGVALVAGGGFFGGYDLLKMLDRSPQLTLSEDGFCDHRVTTPVVIPWSHITALGYRGGGSSGWTLELILTDGGRVLVPATYLAVKPKEMVRLIREFAPEVEVERIARLWLGKA